MNANTATIDAWTRKCPATWEIRPMKRVAAVFNSNVDKKSYDDGVPVRLCNYTDVYHREFITDDLPLMAATATATEVQRFTLRAGDVIITKDSESWNDIAVPACVPEDLPGVVCGYHLTMLRPTPSRMHGRFLLRCLQASGIREQFWVAANGITRFGLGQAAIRDALIPVPPVHTQRAIADFLDRKTAAIDGLIEKKERLIALLEEKRQALITQAVTKGLDPRVPMKHSGIEWLGEIPAHWEVKPIKRVCRLETGHTPSRGEPTFWIEDECVIPWVSLNDSKTLRTQDYINETAYRISPKGMAGSSAHLIPAGAVVFTRDATVGLTAITLQPMAVSQHIIAWVCGPEILNEYLLRVIGAMSPELNRLTWGATIKTIGMGDIRELWTPVPPRAEQEKIFVYLRGALERRDASVHALRESVDRLREYRQALITAAVTGQLDIPEGSAEARP